MKYFVTLLMTAFCSCGERAQDAAEFANSDTIPVINTRQDAAISSHRTSPFTAIMKQMVSEMAGASPTGDADHDFATMMIMHHRGAVRLGEVQLRRGSDTTLLDMAERIIASSGVDLEALQQFVRNNQPTRQNDFAKRAVLMMKRSAGTPIVLSGNVDRDFVAMMIRHHQDGIEMAHEYLPESKPGVPRDVAQKIIDEQAAEIAGLEDILKNYLQESTAGSDAPNFVE